MPNIKPISDLRNYSKVLDEVAVGSPVYLTKNGRGKYAVVDIASTKSSRRRFNCSRLSPKASALRRRMGGENWIKHKEARARTSF